MLMLIFVVASAALPPEQFNSDRLLRVQVLADNGLPSERPVKPGRPFYTQQVTFDGFLEFADREQEKEARRKYDMDMSDYFSLTEWVGVSAGDGSFRHRGWLYCVRRSRFGTEKCFQDSDADGKFDHLTTLDPDQPTRFLRFDAVPPLAYRYLPRERKPIGAGSYRPPPCPTRYQEAAPMVTYGTSERTRVKVRPPWKSSSDACANPFGSALPNVAPVHLPNFAPGH